MNDKEILMDVISYLDDKLLEDWYNVAGFYDPLAPEKPFNNSNLRHDRSTNEGDYYD